MEQAIDVALRFEEEPDLLAPTDDESYLIRVPSKEGSTLTWVDAIMDVPPPEFQPILITIPTEKLAQAKRLPRTRLQLEVDFFLLASARIMDDPQHRPYFPYMLLGVDSESGMVLGSELLNPQPSLDAMRGSVAATLLEQLIRVKMLPAQINVLNPMILQMLLPLSKELKIKLKQVSILPALEEAREFLLERFER